MAFPCRFCMFLRGVPLIHHDLMVGASTYVPAMVLGLSATQVQPGTTRALVHNSILAQSHLNSHTATLT